ncbi:MAG: UvrD-helicase domain-containing protein [Coriobacteriia bacterium]|nr:UvrD-helicase domain-containing protein [Coriobacteriia bacterium]
MAFKLNPEQEQAATTLTGTVLVVAGAGSGKTRVLTERFINAVKPDAVDRWAVADVGEIAAITYTNKAASELTERVRAALRAAGLDEASRHLDTAWVSTIHGLCSRLLHRHAFEAGVDPQFAVGDGVIVDRTNSAALDEVAAALVRSDQGVAELFDIYTYAAVRAAAEELATAVATNLLSFDDVRTEPAAGVDEVLVGMREVFEMGVGICSDVDMANPVKHLLACQDRLDAINTMTRVDGAVQASDLIRCFSGFRPMKPQKDVDYEECVLQAIRFETVSDKLARLVSAHFSAALIRLATAYSVKVAEARQDAGILDFDDLQVEAVRLLTEHPEIAQRYREKFRLVMVDEFQDTDRLQLKLVNALSDDDLCTVGDEKQSIYRFRGADVETYRRHRKAEIANGAVQVSLSVNYRSHPDILGFVNALFAGPEYFDDMLLLDAPDGAIEAADAQPKGLPPRIEAIFIDEACGNVAEKRPTEAEEIAKRFIALHEQGVPYGDMAILVRKYKQAEHFIDALSRRGVPATVLGGSRYFGLNEVAVLRSLTRAIANVKDSAAIGRLLVSDFCPLSEDSLALLGLSNADRGADLWQLLGECMARLSPADGAAVAAFRSAIENATAELGTRPLSEVLLGAVERSGWDLRLLQQGNRGRDAFANVLKYSRLAAAFESNLGTGPAAFAEYLDAQEDAREKQSAAVIADDGTQAVRIISVHSAKGLEFPVVAVIEPDAGGRNSGPLARIEADDAEIRLAVKPAKIEDNLEAPATPWWTAMEQEDKAASAEESKRLHYVALTRARDHLIVSGPLALAPGKAKSGHMALLAAAVGLSEQPADADEFVATLIDPASAREIACAVSLVRQPWCEEPDGEDADSGIEVAGQGTCEPVRRDRPQPAMPERLSYSAFSLYADCPRKFLAHRVLSMGRIEVSETGSTDALTFGSAMHSVLELVGADGRLPAAERIDALARYYELADTTRVRLDDALRRYVDSSVARDVLAHERIAREMSFDLPIADGRALLGGNIDIYARTGSRGLVVDYKSGRSKSPGEILEKYELQAKCYALVALTDGCEEVDVVFVMPERTAADGSAETAVRTFTSADADALRSEIDRRYSEIAGSSFDPLPKYSEWICGECAAPNGLCPNAKA